MSKIEYFSPRTISKSFEAKRGFQDILFHEIQEAYEQSLLVPEGTKPALFFPGNFDQLSSLRRALQEFKVTIPRDPLTQEAYLNLRKQRLREGFDLKQDLISRSDGQPILIERDSFPARLSADTIHYLVWNIHGIPLLELADHTYSFIQEQQLEPNDLVFARNPTWKQSAGAVDHLHLFLRKK